MSDLILVDNAMDMIKNAVRRGKLPWMPRAQDVLKKAEEQARKDGFDLAGTEHILLGILSVKECIGVTILNNHGVTSTIFQQRYEQLCQSLCDKTTGKAKLSEDIDKVIRCAYEQAAEWAHTYIGTEHLLVGILLAGAGAGFEILTDLGVTLEKVRAEAAKLIVCKTKTGQ